MTTSTFVLLMLGMGLVAYEFWAVGRPAPGDTISEHIWQIRASLLGRMFIGALMFWLPYHFVIDQYSGQGWPDAAAILLGVGMAVWRGRFRGRKP